MAKDETPPAPNPEAPPAAPPPPPPPANGASSNNGKEKDAIFEGLLSKQKELEGRLEETKAKIAELDERTRPRPKPGIFKPGFKVKQ